MSISLIVPTLNESSCLAETIRSLRQQRPLEIIVVDGGSTDRTREAAAEADQFLTAPRGRALQMNAGAAGARGDILLFLHADCTLEEGALAEVERCLRRPHLSAGCFTMRVEAPGWRYRWIDLVALARVRLAGLIYGDQGLFVRRHLFEQLGGFPSLRLMEDVYFSRMLHKRERLVVANSRIFVSARRWQKTGILRQTLRNWTLLTLAASGVSSDRLAAFYPAVR